MGTAEVDERATAPWRVRVDPEGRAWRNATRGVVMAVPLFAVYAALDLVVWAPWAFIGLLNTLLPDIGGPLRPRVRTGIEILVGSVLMAFLGALVADQPVALVAAMFVVAFAAAYIGVLSPYLAAAGTSVLLVFLLSGGSPTTELSEAGWRAANVAVGAALAVVAVVVVLPARRRRRVEPALAAACRAVADLLDPPVAGDGSGHDLDPEARAQAAVTAMITAITSQRWPPLSSSRVDRARLAFAHDLQSLFSRAMAIHRSDVAGHTAGGEDERTTAADGLRALGAWLVDEGRGPDGSAVRAAAERAAALELRMRDAAGAAVGDGEALERFRVARRIAAACHLTATLADGAAAAAFHTEQGAPVARGGLVDVTRSETRYWPRLVLNLSPTSMAFRHAVRLGAACAIAAAAERALHLEHGYWAVLTVVVTLRTSRGASASRSFERLLGTVGGVVLASVSIAIAEASEARTTVIMGLTVLTLAATLWTGAARLRWAWGVVAITSCVLTMFQLETPGDWTLEAERLVATVLGLAIALGAAFLLWPGSAAVSLRRALGDGARALAILVTSLGDTAPNDRGQLDEADLERSRRGADRHVAQARSTLGAAIRDEAVGADSALTAAVLELEQAAELVRRVDDSLTGSFRTAAAGPVSAMVDATTTAAAASLHDAAGRFLDETGRSASTPPPTPVEEVAAAEWGRLTVGDGVDPQVLDAIADLGTLGHRSTDLSRLATTP